MIKFGRFNTILSLFSAVFLPVLAIAGISIDVTAQSFSWETYSSHGNVRQLVTVGSDIWGATSGGIFKLNTAMNETQIFSNIDGLSGVNVRAIEADPNGYLWAGLDDGKLNRITLSDDRIDVYTIDPDPLKVNDIVYHDGILYLAFDFGISVYLIEKNEINSTFRTLGDFPTNTAVNKLYIHNDVLWVATNFGVATVSLNAPNLQDPQFWTSYTVQNGLASNRVNDFYAIDNSLYAGTVEGVSRFDGNHFINDGLIGIDEIKSLVEKDGQLYAIGQLAAYIRSGVGTWQSLTPNISNLTAIVNGPDNAIWVGHTNAGLYRYVSGAWENLLPPGPGGNIIETTYLDSQNRLWATTGSAGNNGAYLFKNGQWRRLSIVDGLSAHVTAGITEGPDGRIWMGTLGAGVMILDLQGDDLTVTKIDAASGLLAGSDTQEFIIAARMKTDSEGNIWILNSFASNGNALVAVTPNFEWHYFSTITDGLSSNHLLDLTFDEFGRVWIGSEGDGVDMLDYKGTLSVHSDDEWVHYGEEEGMISNRIIRLDAQPNNGIWVATPEGLNHIYEGFPVMFVYNEVSSNIRTVAVDPAGNKWIGTPVGISLLRSDDLTWEHYTTMNSGLVDNEITSFYIDDESGTVYIGTSGGLSVATTPFRTPPADANSLKVYPNPFISGPSGDILMIESFPLNSEIKIFTLTGRLVRTLLSGVDVNGSQATWDGLDSNGSYVPSGIYFVTAGSSGANTGVQKLAIIRK